MQGRVRTKTVKRAARVLVEKYYQKLTLDFDTNKRICEDVADIQTKRLRNKIAGFTTVRLWLLPGCCTVRVAFANNTCAVAKAPCHMLAQAVI